LTITPTTIRDKTECPGDFCIYTGSDLHIDATHLCQQRTSGAKNWQVYIKDNRDSKIYRVIQMPNGEWWLADYLDYIQSGITTLVYDGLRYYKSWPTCPANWTIWSVSKAKSLITTYGSTNLTRVKATSRWLTKFAGDDYYGLTLYPTHSVNINWTGATNDFDNSTISVVPSCSTAKDLGAGIYQGNAWSDCFDDDGNVAKRRDPPGVPVRCFRQL
ncbi:MAG: hypothetical protein LBU42_03675, partial [Prevotellaceae bacterium]|jgi:uncharacterized protein (TIGR02145 family)|nr:hypothetical protein [Prevotellaceae bacterium]